MLSLFVDHERLLLGMEDGLCVVELNKDSKLWHYIKIIILNNNNIVNLDLQGSQQQMLNLVPHNTT